MTAPQTKPAIVKGDTADYAIQEKRMYLEAGVLGKFFGMSSNAAANVAGFVVCTLILAGVLMAFFSPALQVTEYFKLVSPIVTLALGYMFGRKTS